MILSCCINVLNVLLVIHKCRYRPYKFPASAKAIEHRLPVTSESESVMILHLPRYPRIVTRRPYHKVRSSRHKIGYTFTPALVKYGRIGNSIHISTLYIRIVTFNLSDILRYYRRLKPYSLVRLFRTAVILAYPVYAPLCIHCVPPYRKRLCVPEIKTTHDCPVFRYLKRFYNVRPQPVLVVNGIIPPLREHLSRKTVPIAVQQSFFLRSRKHRQACKIRRVVFEQLLVVEHTRRYKHP